MAKRNNTKRKNRIREKERKMFVFANNLKMYKIRIVDVVVDAVFGKD